MRSKVIARPAVQDLLKNFVYAELWTDRDRETDRENARLLKERFGTAALPLYVVLGPDDRERSRLEGVSGVDGFVEFLKKGIR